MQIKLNGKSLVVKDGIKLVDLLKDKVKDVNKIIVEYNYQILSKERSENRAD